MEVGKMALGEIARDLQKTASDELLLLRDMRRYVNLNNDRALQAERQRLADFDASPEALTMEGQKRRCRMFAELDRKSKTKIVYQRVLHCAEDAERKQKGGGEKYVRLTRPKINELMERIENRYQRLKEYQLTITSKASESDAIAKEGAADGARNGENGNQAAAAAAGGGGQGGGTAEETQCGFAADAG